MQKVPMPCGMGLSAVLCCLSAAAGVVRVVRIAVGILRASGVVRGFVRGIALVVLCAGILLVLAHDIRSYLRTIPGISGRNVRCSELDIPSEFP